MYSLPTFLLIEKRAEYKYVIIFEITVSKKCHFKGNFMRIVQIESIFQYNLRV